MAIKSSAKRIIRVAALGGSFYGVAYTVLAFLLAPDEASPAGIPQEGFDAGSSLFPAVLALIGGSLGGVFAGLVVAAIIKIAKKNDLSEAGTVVVSIFAAGFIGAGLGFLFSGFFGASPLANPTIASISSSVVTASVCAVTLAIGPRRDKNTSDL